MVSKKILLIGILFYSCSSFSVAQNTSTLVQHAGFDINGMKLGDKLTTEFFKSYCPARLKDSSEIECKQKMKLNDVNLSVLYFFYKSKLIAISFNYPSSKYNDFIKTYTKKFEQSPQNRKESIVLNTGEKHINNIVSWQTKSEVFVIEQYWNSFNKGAVHLSSAEYEKYKVKKSKSYDDGLIDKIFGDFFD